MTHAEWDDDREQPADDDDDDRDLPHENDLTAEGDDEPASLCPSCGEEMSELAQRCPACGDWVTPVAPGGAARRAAQTAIVILLVIGLLVWLLI